jgi:hypothetical protein
MHNELNAIEVARYVRVFEPVTTTELARIMRETHMRVYLATKTVAHMGFIVRLPGDKRWRVVRVG